jgi:Rrf2 family transcriptional regulator, iron-sulfur cluster assembly transcription factor
MSILFSRQCEYAIQAVLYLALQPEGKQVPTNALTRKLKIPYHFLGKIMQSLTRKGLLRSEKGPKGGFSLALPAEDITLFHIVDAVDGAAFTRTCVLGFPECSGKNPCAVHEAWGAQRDQIYQMLVSRNIAEMARDTKKPEYRTRKS